MNGKLVIQICSDSSGSDWGNGKAAAALYAREGASVLAVDYRIAAALETAEQID